MSLCRVTPRRSATVALLLGLLTIAVPALLSAQDQNPPKVDLFVGYQWLHPGVTIANGVDAFGNPIPFKLPDIAQGVGAAGAYNFTRFLGAEFDYGGSWNKYSNVTTISVGPRFMWRGENVDFFIHALGGLNRLTPKNLDADDGVGAILGGGMDLRIFKHLQWRVFQADFVAGHHNFSNLVGPTDPHLQRPNMEGARLRSGLVFEFGGGKEAPVAAACSVQPSEVMVGEPVHATVSPSNFNPKHALQYNWSSTGGKIEGKDNGASIDTNGMTGGSYTVTARVTDPKSKKNNEASCTSNFTVKEPPKNPPQVSCSASPSSVKPGETSTISCTCTSPDNVPVTVGNWTASGGSISGNGNSAALNTTGASAGPITVSATCTDSRGLTASTSSTVNVENPPPPPPPPQANKLNECTYPNKAKPWRVDNTCKAALDDVAAKLQQDPDAKLVVVGNNDPKEKRKNLAAERAVDVKYYLTQGEAQQHIDASRIETRTGNEGTAISEQWIVPAGATFPEADSTTPVDEAKVKAIPDHPKPAAKKPAKKAQ